MVFLLNTNLIYNLDFKSVCIDLKSTWVLILLFPWVSQIPINPMYFLQNHPPFLTALPPVVPVLSGFFHTGNRPSSFTLDMDPGMSLDGFNPNHYPIIPFLDASLMMVDHLRFEPNPTNKPSVGLCKMSPFSG